MVPVPVEAAGVSDEDDGYTSSPTASVCSLMVSPSERRPESALAGVEPNGAGEPLFPRFEGFEVVSVTPVDSAVGNAAQIERKPRIKGRGFGDHKPRRWRSRSGQHDRFFRSQDHVTVYDHRRMKIPPLPEEYSLLALNQEFYRNPPPPMQPPLSEEEKNANLVDCLRDEVKYDGVPLIPPEELPSKVQFQGFTEDGTVMITFLDEKNQRLFERNRERIEMVFGMKEVFKFDTRIQKKDIFEGRIVLASIPRQNGGVSPSNIRAMITSFNDKWIIVDGVDYPITNRKLSYDNVFYMWNELNFSPFQLQEVHLDGLENREGHPTLRLIVRRVMGALSKWAEEERVKGPVNLVLKEIQKGKDGYKVWLDFPDEFLDGLSLNEIMMEGFRNFDPFVDYLVTP